MTSFEIIAWLLTLTAIGGYLNHRFVKFPPTIGLMAFSFALSLLAMLLNKLGWLDLSGYITFIDSIDLSEVLLHGMLSFLLFAGALQINIDELKSVKWAVGILAISGVVIATFVTGTLVWFVAGMLSLKLPYFYALLFGALISPTDPIAVLSILKQSGLPRRLYVKIGAESLFNDGIGVVAFITILGLADGTQPIDPTLVIALLIRQALGGAIVGICLGWITYLLLRSIDSYTVEILLTLSLVTGGYVLAESLNCSAPICVVVAGLILGNRGRNLGIDLETKSHLDEFWELLDEILNAVLFIMIGLEILVISLSTRYITLGIFAIVAVLLGRIISVGIPSGLLRFDWKMITLFTWGGLKGGLSIAMALSLPAGPEKAIILPITYIVVLFSILVQGLTFKSSLKFLG